MNLTSNIQILHVGGEPKQTVKIYLTTYCNGINLSMLLNLVILLIIIK